jgi:CHAT domain-containing protein/tetratricopeptide (TPR) repeat protein
MNKHSSPRRSQFVNLTNLPHRARRSFVVVLVLALLPFASTSSPRALAQIPDEREAAAKKSYQDGAVLSQQGTAESLRAAIGKFETARSLFHETKYQLGEALSLLALGRVYGDLGEKQQALAYYNRALSLFKAVGSTQGGATTLNNIGLVYSSQGEKQKALEHFNLALPLFRADKDRRGVATTLNNIGGVYSDLGEDQKALEHFNQALPLFRAVKDGIGEALTLDSIGLVYSSRDEKQKALEHFNQALPLFRAVKDRRGEALTLDSIGLVYSALGEKQKALEHHNQALPLVRAVGDRGGEARALNNIGAAYSALGEKQKALEHYNQALPLVRAIGDRGGEARALSNMMIVCLALNNSRLAVFFGKQSVNRYQELRRAIHGLDKQTQKTYLQTVASTYRSLADLLIEQGRLPEAQFVLSLLKDEEYFEFVRRDKDEIAALAKSVEFNEVERKAFAEHARLADELTAIGAKYQTLFDKRSKLGGQPLPVAAEEAEFQQLSQLLATTSDTFQRFLARLAQEFASAKPANNIQIERINELQADLREVGPDAVLVSTFVLPDRYRIILTTGQTQVDRKTEIKEADLNRKLSCFLMALKNPRVDPRPLGKELYDILVKPLEQDLERGKFKTILWSLDGALRYVPIAALWDGEHYLAERYENAIITLGRNSRLFREVNRDWRALGAGVSAKWPGFAELPAVKTELRSIVHDERLAAETEGVLPGRLLLDGEFLSSRLKDLLPSSERGRRFNLIHIASHFKLRQTRDSSFLLLGDGTELSLTEFDKDPRLKLTGVELLTLSACETGVGIDKGDGSEFESLGMLAEKNGAKAVMATLWQVADCSTGEFMREFYRLYQQAQQQGITKATALQRAQRAMMSGAIQVPGECQARKAFGGTNPDVCAMPPFSPNPAKPFAHPYYWAPFVLFGNWR